MSGPALANWDPVPGYAWAGATSHDEDIARHPYGAPMTLTIDWIPAAIPVLIVQVEASVSQVTGKTATITVGGKEVISWPAGQAVATRTVTLRSRLRPLTITVKDAWFIRGARIRVSLPDPMPATRLLPAHVLALETQDDAGHWQDVIGRVTAITTRRGFSSTNPVRGGEPGTMTVNLAGRTLTPDTLTRSFPYGKRLRLYDWYPGSAAQIPIWSGWITSVTYTPYKGRPGGTATVEAADAASRLAEVTRYGATVKQTAAERVTSLVRSAEAALPGVRILQRVVRAGKSPLQPTVWETSLAAHLDAINASILAVWYVQGDGDVLIADSKAAHETQNPLTITDGSITTTPTQWRRWGIRDTWYYSAIDPGFSTSAIVSAIRVTNHGAVKEGTQWRAADTTHTVTSRANPWGGVTVNVDTTTTDAEAKVLALDLLSFGHSTRPLPRSVTVPVITDQTPSHLTYQAMAAAAEASPHQTVVIEHAGQTTHPMTAVIAHTITPTTWTTRIELA